jgi:hypothetical protein
MKIGKPVGPNGPKGGAMQASRASVGEGASSSAKDTSDPWRPSTEAVQAADPKTLGAPPVKTSGLEVTKDGHLLYSKPTEPLGNVAAMTLSTVGQPSDSDRRGGMSPLTHMEMKRRGMAKPKDLAERMYGTSRGSRFSADGEGGY